MNISPRFLIAVVFLTLCLWPTDSRCLDQSPMWSFRYKDKSLSGAYVEKVTQKGVEVAGKDSRGNSASIVVSLEDAAKMPALQLKAKKEIAEQRSLKTISESQQAAAARRRANPGEEQAFDMHRKISEGWIVYVCEKQLDEARPASSSYYQSIGFASSEYVPNYVETKWESTGQMALLRNYGKPAAEGERIITNIKKGEPKDVDVNGTKRTLRAYDVVGEDRKEATESSSPLKAAPSNEVQSSEVDARTSAHNEGAPSLQTAVVAAGSPAQLKTELTIVSAIYGADDMRKDVTQLVAAKVSDDRLNFQADNGELGGDPAFGKVKKLRVKFVSSGQEAERTFREGEQVSLP